MYAMRFETDLFNGADDALDGVLSIRSVAHACTFLYKMNCEYLAAYGAYAPLLYDAGIRYQTPTTPCGGDVWQHISILYKCKTKFIVDGEEQLCNDPFCTHNNRYGDCKDLACALAAELTVKKNILAIPVVRRRWLTKDFALYHVVVQYPDGKIEDPSLILGMPSALAA